MTVMVEKDKLRSGSQSLRSLVPTTPGNPLPLHKSALCLSHLLPFPQATELQYGGPRGRTARSFLFPLPVSSQGRQQALLSILYLMSQVPHLLGWMIMAQRKFVLTICIRVVRLMVAAAKSTSICLTGGRCLRVKPGRTSSPWR